MDNSKQSQIDKLMELKQLYEKGILTKEEMEDEKAKILNAPTPKVESPSNEIPSVEDAGSSFASNSDEESHGCNIKVIIGIAAVIVVAIVAIIGFFLNKQTEPKEAVKDDVELAQLADDPFSDCIIIKDLFDIILKGDISELKTFLKTNGFKPNGKDEEYSSAEWTKMYGTAEAESDVVSIQMEKVRELVYLDLSCAKDAIMDKWISEIKALGYTFEESSVEGEDKTLSFNKSNGASGLIQYRSSPKKIRLNVITNFGYIAENEDNSDDISARDDAYEYNFVGKIKGKADQYPFKMAFNINEEGKVSGYYIVTDGDSERVLLKGSVTGWPDKHEGQISLFEFDEAKNDYTGLYFQGDLNIEYSQSGSFAGYSINNGRYKDAADIDWPFTAESM